MFINKIATKTNGSMELKCAICSENPKKYKCKTCEVPYCSLTCYKSHQETPCEAPPKTDSPLIQEDRNQPQRTYLYTTVDTVDPAMLEQLRHSDPLKNLLYNPHLRRLLQEIDAAPDAMKAVRVAMMEPLFVEFADQCLRVVEPANASETHDQTLLNS